MFVTFSIYVVHNFQSSIRPDRIAQLVEHRSSNLKPTRGFLLARSGGY
jgi:hypothetical protein